MDSSSPKCIPLMRRLSQTISGAAPAQVARSETSRTMAGGCHVLVTALHACARALWSSARAGAGPGRGRALLAASCKCAAPPARAQSLRAYRKPTIVSAVNEKTRKLVRARLSETLASKNFRMYITRNSKKRCWTAAFYSGFILMSPTGCARARRGAAAGVFAPALSLQRKN